MAGGCGPHAELGMRLLANGQSPQGCAAPMKQAPALSTPDSPYHGSARMHCCIRASAEPFLNGPSLCPAAATDPLRTRAFSSAATASPNPHFRGRGCRALRLDWTEHCHPPNSWSSSCAVSTQPYTNTNVAGPHESHSFGADASEVRPPGTV